MISWSLFERKCLGCDANGKTIKDFAGNQTVQKCFSKIEPLWNQFYKRYTHKEKGSLRISKLFPDVGKRGEKNKKDGAKFEKYLQGQLSEAKKTELMALIVFRFRNNIFHGLKKPYTWPRYEKQIRQCIRTIMIWVDEYREDSAV